MNSKILLFISFTWLASSVVMAQPTVDEKHKHYLFGTPLRYNGFGGPFIAFSNVEGKASIAPGAVGGIIINDKFFLSAFGEDVVSSHPRHDFKLNSPAIYTNAETKLWQVGIWFGYLHRPEEVVHWGISSRVARGQLYLFAKDPVTLDMIQILDDRVYFITPQFFVEMNFSKWLKMNVSAGYRFTGKINGAYTDLNGNLIPLFYSSDYNQPEFSVSFLFGGFPSKTRASQ